MAFEGTDIFKFASYDTCKISECVATLSGTDTPNGSGCSLFDITFNVSPDSGNYYHFYSKNNPYEPDGTYICPFTVTCKYCENTSNCPDNQLITSNVMTLRSKQFNSDCTSKSFTDSI